jgi:alpha-L-fucosidase
LDFHIYSDYKTTNKIVDVFIDIVSKNGCMLLNVAPKADGSFPEEQKNVMLGIGNWLKINGEVIYNYDIWDIVEEGSTKFVGGMFSEKTLFPILLKI